MAYNKMDDLVLEDVDVIFKHLSGEADSFHKEGDRDFSVVLRDAGEAERLARMGWPVKVREPKEEGDDPLRTLKVKVNCRGAYPPNVVLVTKRGGRMVSRVRLDEESIGQLDALRFDSVDVILSPYNWTMPTGQSGVSAYLKSGYFVVEQDVLAAKYSIEEEQMMAEEEIPF